MKPRNFQVHSRTESGGAPPQSMTLARWLQGPNIRQVLECARCCGALDLAPGLWSQCIRKSERWLSMNLVADTVKWRQILPSVNQPPRHRGGYGLMVPMHAQKSGRTLSLTRPSYRNAVWLGKATLKTHALQTLTRGPLTRPQARSVWSASDLSALSVRGGTARGSGPQRLPC